jgi:hypothetical protein
MANNSSFLNGTGSLSFVNTGSYNAFSSSYNTGSFTGSFKGDLTGSFSGSLYNLQGTPTHIPFFSASQILEDSAMIQIYDGSGVYSIAINENGVDATKPRSIICFSNKYFFIQCNYR